MPNLIYASSSGCWELYLSCIEEVIPWAFAYDRQNYARYLIPFLKNIRHLCVRIPEVYAAFNKGKFSVQVGDRNHFGRNEADKTIENNISRDIKTGEVYIGFQRGVYNKLLLEYLFLISSPDLNP